MKTSRTEGIVQVLILIIVAGMAGAASFTHVHNWTMTNAPAGTGSWFGWANAIISELTPTAAGIEIRRRKRHPDHPPIGYPMAILLGAAALSLSAQVAEARPTIGGWISSAVPALAFLALTKLVLSRPSAKESEPAWNQNQAGNPVSTTTATAAPDGSKFPSEATATPARPAPLPSQHSPLNSSSNQTQPTKTPSPASAASSVPTPASADSGRTPDTATATAELIPAPSGQLLMSGRMAAFAHQQATGQPVTPGELADRMGTTPEQAGTILRHLDGITPPSVTAANGTPVINGSSRP
jgi:hypothetical protein